MLFLLLNHYYLGSLSLTFLTSFSDSPLVARKMSFQTFSNRSLDPVYHQDQLLLQIYFGRIGNSRVNNIPHQ